MKTKMWHEARKQEKKIKGILVDYRKRAERRHDFYEATKSDPNQFLRIHGTKCRIHFDTEESDLTSLIPWQGQQDILIDRFDARTHLDFILPPSKKPDTDDCAKDMEERQFNYERYRVLVQNEFLGVNEEKFLQQLQMEEQFGINSIDDKNTKKKAQAGATIGFQYSDSHVESFSQTISNIESASAYSRYDEYGKDSSDSDLDLNLDMKKIGSEEGHGLNHMAHRYGLQSNDFYSFLTKDADDREALKMQQEEEQEKILYCGRKGRRERRAQRERRFNVKSLIDADTKPSYALEDKPVTNENKQDSAESRSPSPPETTEKITYITSFGGEEEQAKKMTFSEKVKQNLGTLKKLNETSKRNESARKRYSSSDSSYDGYRYRRHHQKRSRSRSRYRYSSRGRRKDRSKSRTHSTSSSSSNNEKVNNEGTKIPSRTLAEEKNLKETSTKVEPVVKRYYGRRRDSSNSSDEGDIEEKSSNNQCHGAKTNIIVGKISTTNPKASTSGNTKNTSTMNAREVLKRKMQILLNKQYKEDKKIENMKKIQQLQEQKDRENEMRELALKLRKRQRELRHRYSTPECSDSNDSIKAGTAVVDKSSTNKRNKRSRTKSIDKRHTRSSSRSRKSHSSSPRRSRKSRSPYKSSSRHHHSSHYRPKYRSRSRSRSRAGRRRDRSRSYDRRPDRSKYSRRSRSRR